MHTPHPQNPHHPSRPQSDPLLDLGFRPAHAAALAELVRTDPSLVPARVARAERDRLLVLTALDASPRPAIVRGRMRHEAGSGAELPAVGDWVAFVPSLDGDSLVHAVLPRQGALTRLDPAKETREQIVAANVDVLFLVSGLDNDFNPRRIERFVTAAWESGARPVVLLNKADLVDPALAAERAGAIGAAAPGVPVLVLSAAEGAGIGALAPHLAPRTTVALVGSSGVGKSTLVNRLLGDARAETGAVRAHDQRGRHTTTWRELVPLPGGAILVDTPGMRTLALWSDDGEAMLERGFADVESFAARCRFSDCAHETEPGCAVHAALASGELAEERWTSWRKLGRELRALERRQDVQARLKEKKLWKERTKGVREHMKRKYGE